jgi:hypothetical protein
VKILTNNDDNAASTSPEACAELIRANWHKAVDSILEVARLCAQANERLDADQKKQLFKLLPFSHPVFSKLAQIGSDERLYEEDVRKRRQPVIRSSMRLDS